MNIIIRDFIWRIPEAPYEIVEIKADQELENMLSSKQLSSADINKQDD